MSLAQIDRHTGLGRGTAARLARQYGIPIRGGTDDSQRVHPDLPRDWPYAQHVTEGRRLADLARQKQLSKTTVKHWARIYRIPIQRGRPARMDIPAAAAAAPARLRPAITGPNAWQRLHRLAAVSRHPSLAAAAAALGTHPSTLIHQIDRLEREFGQPLLELDGQRRTTRPTRPDVRSSPPSAAPPKRLTPPTGVDG